MPDLPNRPLVRFRLGGKIEVDAVPGREEPGWHWACPLLSVAVVRYLQRSQALQGAGIAIWINGGDPTGSVVVTYKSRRGVRKETYPIRRGLCALGARWWTWEEA